MHNKIRLLVELQEYDTKITEIEHRKEKLPKEIEAISKRIEKVKKQLETASENLNALKKERRQVETDIDDMATRIKKSNEKLSTIKTNKEYRAALKEIDELGEEKARLEDRLLEIMEAIEAAERKQNVIKQKIKEEEKAFEQEKKEILKEEKALEMEINKLKEQRERLCQEINSMDGSLLERYNFLRLRKGGIAVSPVIKGVCQTCHLGIPPQKFNELIKGEKLMTCPHCMRIIYWGDDERYQEKKEEVQ